MCFRPATAETAFICPECGKKINPIMGNLPDTCPFCEADISNAKNATTPGAPSTPSTPATPGVPTAPGAPSAPSAPKGPGA